jgi:hypothetical protein
MKIIEFEGYRCTEKPLTDWRNWICKHLEPYVSKPDANSPSSLVCILQDGRKSSEIFLFIKGPLPQITERGTPLLKANAEVISCNSCWINVYNSTKLSSFKFNSD